MDSEILNQINAKLNKINEVSEQLNKLDEKIVNIDAKLNNLEKKFEDRFKSIESNISKLKAETNLKIHQITKNSTDHKTANDDEIESIKRANELIVNGFPANNNMDFNELYKKIASVIGFSEVSISNEFPAIPEAKMFKLKSKSTTESTLVIRFATLYHKEIFLANYFKNTKECKLSKFGFSGESRIYIHNNLTSKRYSALKCALNLKKNGKIHQVKTFAYGALAIKFTKDTDFIIVRSIEEINSKIFEANAGPSRHERSTKK
jgi:phenylalanyl-tRNA synthetase alpha subunit